MVQAVHAEFVGTDTDACDSCGGPSTRVPCFHLLVQGETLGVAVAAPITLALFARPRADWDSRRVAIVAPLLRLSKAGIVRLGTRLGVPYHLTQSCYDPVRGRACGRCDACQLRRKGFLEAGVPDPTPYVRAGRKKA